MVPEEEEKGERETYTIPCQSEKGMQSFRCWHQLHAIVRFDVRGGTKNERRLSAQYTMTEQHVFHLLSLAPSRSVCLWYSL